jgi:hypothetical protein
MRKSILLSALLATLTIGCSDNTQRRTYDISVSNETAGPITVWLTKDGGPIEPGWRSPEQLARVAPAHEERIAGLVIPPGKTGATGPVEGHFQRGADAWLRIYEGQRKFSEILAISHDSPSRIDVPLRPGQNRLKVHTKSGQIAATPAAPDPAQP